MFSGIGALELRAGRWYYFSNVWKIIVLVLVVSTSSIYSFAFIKIPLRQSILYSSLWWLLLAMLLFVSVNKGDNAYWSDSFSSIAGITEEQKRLVVTEYFSKKSPQSRMPTITPIVQSNPIAVSPSIVQWSSLPIPGWLTSHVGNATLDQPLVSSASPSSDEPEFDFWITTATSKLGNGDYTA